MNKPSHIIVLAMLSLTQAEYADSVMDITEYCTLRVRSTPLNVSNFNSFNARLRLVKAENKRKEKNNFLPDFDKADWQGMRASLLSGPLRIVIQVT